MFIPFFIRIPFVGSVRAPAVHISNWQVCVYWYTSVIPGTCNISDLALGGTTQLPGLIGTWGDASIFDIYISCGSNDLEEFRHDHNDQSPHSGLYQMLRHVACWRCTALYTLYRHFFLVSNYGISWLCSCYKFVPFASASVHWTETGLLQITPSFADSFQCRYLKHVLRFLWPYMGHLARGSRQKTPSHKNKVETDGTNHAQGGGCIQNRLSHAPWVGDHVRSCYLAHGVSLV